MSKRKFDCEGIAEVVGEDNSANDLDLSRVRIKLNLLLKDVFADWDRTCAYDIIADDPHHERDVEDIESKEQISESSHKFTCASDASIFRSPLLKKRMSGSNHTNNSSASKSPRMSESNHINNTFESKSPRMSESNHINNTSESKSPPKKQTLESTSDASDNPPFSKKTITS
jgi:hypothetical protein